MVALLVTGAGGWLLVGVLALVDYTNVAVALIAAIASVSNTMLIAKYNRGQRELRAIRRDQLDVKRKLGVTQRDTDS